MDLTLLQDAAAHVATALETAHDGELDATAIGTISVLAGSLGRLFLPVIPFVSGDDKRQRLAVMTLSALALGLYCRQDEIAVIGHGFTIISAFCVVALATLGTFNLSDPKNYTKENISAVTNAATFGLAGTAAPTTPKE